LTDAFKIDRLQRDVKYIIADKTDVRRSRVRNRTTIKNDIHDRVNYFEIFMSRMLLSRKAADMLGLHFKLNINGASLL